MIRDPKRGLHGTASTIRRTRRYPFDLIAVLAVLLVAAVTLRVEDGSLIRTIVGTVTVLLLPGYVTTAALVPWHEHDPERRRSKAGSRLTLRERAVASLGLSVAIVPIVAVIFGRFGDGLTTPLAFQLVAGYVIVVTGIAAYRRVRLPPSDRFYIPVGAWVGGMVTALTTGSRIDRALSIALIISIVLALGSFGFAVATPIDGEQYTDFHLLTESEDGTYVSANYPESADRNEPLALTWGIENHEGERTAYTVVAVVERMAVSDDDHRRIEMAELHREETVLDPGDRELHDHEIASPLIGDSLRISYYLYRDSAPETPSEETAYRHLHVWVDIGPGA